MTDVIDSIRGLRNATLNFEREMSALTVAIGNMERLSDLEPDQINRLRQAVIRLSNCERKYSREGL
jgi:hypothetical protein